MASDSIDALLKANNDVHIKDLPGVRDIIKKLRADGPSKLHIISDFDMTLTKYWVNGQRSVSSHGVLEKSSFLSLEARLKLKLLYEKYYPIEINQSLSHEERVLGMVEWWEKAHEVIMSAKITKSNINKMVEETPVTFRDGLEEFLTLCHLREIPLLVFSAGLYDLIEAIFLKHGHLREYVSIVSNKMEFDNEETCIGFIPPLIRTSSLNLLDTFNKNEACVSESIHHEKISGRDNIILMGDSLGDIQMSANVSHKLQLKIGFLVKIVIDFRITMKIL